MHLLNNLALPSFYKSCFIFIFFFISLQSDCRQIEAEHEREIHDDHELQQSWLELRHVVRCVYRRTSTDNSLPDTDKIHELIHR